MSSIVPYSTGKRLCLAGGQPGSHWFLCISVSLTLFQTSTTLLLLFPKRERKRQTALNNQPLPNRELNKKNKFDLAHIYPNTRVHHKALLTSQNHNTWDKIEKIRFPY